MGEMLKGGNNMKEVFEKFDQNPDFDKVADQMLH